MASAELPAPVIHELDPAAKAADFREAIQLSKDSSPYGAAVYVYDEADYAGMRLFMTEDGSAGFAIKPDGDIVSVFSEGGGVVFPMLQLAVTQGGGTKLNAFDTVLPWLYGLAGFKETERRPWAEEYIPDGWNKELFGPWNGGEPDVVYMEYDPSYVMPVGESQ